MSNRQRHGKQKKGWGSFEETNYREYEYLDQKTKKKKRFRLKVTNAEDVNEIGDSIFGGRYYTLSQDPTYMEQLVD